jgi:hypothetical protein
MVKEASEFKESLPKAKTESWYRCKENHCTWLDKILIRNSITVEAGGVKTPDQVTMLIQDRNASKLTGSRLTECIMSGRGKAQLKFWKHSWEFVACWYVMHALDGLMRSCVFLYPTVMCPSFLYVPDEGVALFLGLMCSINSWTCFSDIIACAE